MPGGSSRNRFFSELYDSVQQRRYHAAAEGKKTAKAAYSGRLRLDILLSRTLVVTDAQLLDGAVFQDVPAAELVNTLRRARNAPLPLVVRSRSSDLGEALLGFVRDPGKDRLKGFMFSSIRDEAERTGALEELTRTSSSHVKTWRGIAPLLRTFGVAGENVERMESAWARTIELQAKNLIRVEDWGTRKPDFMSALGDPARRIGQLRTDEGRRMADRVFRFDGTRNEADSLFSAYRSVFAGSSRELDDLEAVESLYHRTYNLAISVQHQCDNFETIHRDDRGEGAPAPSGGLSLPPPFLACLADMEPGKFQTEFHANMEHFRNWWKNCDFDSLRRGIDPFVVASEGTGTTSNKQAAGTGIGIGTASLLFGSPGNFLVALGLMVTGVFLSYVAAELYDKDFNRKDRTAQRIVRIAEARKADEKNH